MLSSFFNGKGSLAIWKEINIMFNWGCVLVKLFVNLGCTLLTVRGSQQGCYGKITVMGDVNPKIYIVFAIRSSRCNLYSFFIRYIMELVWAVDILNDVLENHVKIYVACVLVFVCFSLCVCQFVRIPNTITIYFPLFGIWRFSFAFPNFGNPKHIQNFNLLRIKEKLLLLTKETIGYVRRNQREISW